MDLILWRHADAEDGDDDLARNLTHKGHRQAKRMARWLHAYLPARVRVLCSPANRARQTADALHLPYDIADAIAPGANATKLYETSGKGFPMALRKGSVLWLTSRTREGEPGVVVKAAMVPSMLKRG
jgi:phosphohistidine phosphatase